MLPCRPLGSPQLPVEPFQSVKSVTPPSPPLFGVTGFLQSSPLWAAPPSMPPSAPPIGSTSPGVSLFASQLTKVTTLIAGRSYVNPSDPTFKESLEASESSFDVTQGVTLPIEPPFAILNFWVIVFDVLLTAMTARWSSFRYASFW